MWRKTHEHRKMFSALSGDQGGIIWIESAAAGSLCEQRAAVILLMFVLHLFLSSVHLNDTDCQVGPQVCYQ